MNAIAVALLIAFGGHGPASFPTSAPDTLHRRVGGEAGAPCDLYLVLE